jgi:hypothetical protein
VCAAGTVVGFPLCIALALREVESTHAYVSLFSMWLGFFAWGGFKSEAQQRLQWMEVEG